MKNFIFLTVFLVLFTVTSFSVSAETKSKKVFITVDTDSKSSFTNKAFSSMVEHASNSSATVIEVDESALINISETMHHEHHRCGGYIVHEDLEEAKSYLNPKRHKSVSLADYSINQGQLVEDMISKVNESNLRATIQKLSSFKNRYYESQSGVDSQKWIKSHWESIFTGRSDVEVSMFTHSWKQPSVIAKITGSKYPNEVIVIGGHADSIAGYWGRERARAPGADDNASGMATLTEVMNVMASTSYKPERTIYFMAYAAEEVGLRGSKAIAADFKSRGVNVIGALQLDMTNFDGSNGNIALISDNTNNTQNTFLGKILDNYITDVTWSYSKCGYACSDHASWNAQGYPVSFPFEAQKDDMNGKIHTAQDTIARSNGTASHASIFSKIALAFLVELDR